MNQKFNSEDSWVEIFLSIKSEKYLIKKYLNYPDLIFIFTTFNKIYSVLILQKNKQESMSYYKSCCIKKRSKLKNYKPVGSMRFEMVDKKNLKHLTKNFTKNAKLVTPHVLFSPEIQKRGIASLIYSLMHQHGFTFITDSQTQKAAQLWTNVSKINSQPILYINLYDELDCNTFSSHPCDESWKVLLGKNVYLNKQVIKEKKLPQS